MSYASIDDDVLQLCSAIRTQDYSDINFLIHTATDINSQDKNGETALHTAVSYDSTEVVQELVDSGADVNQPNKNGQTPLHIAASNGNFGIASLLLQANADTEAKTKYTEMTALHLASQNGHTDIVKMLVNHGADTASLDAINKAAAFYSGNNEIREILEAEQMPHKLQSKSKHRMNEENDAGMLQDLNTGTNSKGTHGIIGQSGIQKTTQNRNAIQRKTDPSRTPVQHSLMFSKEHKKIMRMNVFDRLTRKKPPK